MKMTNETFDKLRLYVEILGYVLAFFLAVSDIVGFKYGAELSAIVTAFNIMMGSVLNTLRNEYEKENEGDEI